MTQPVIEILLSFIDALKIFLPRLFGGVVLLLIGWIIGMAVGKMTKNFIKRYKIDNYISRGKKPIFRLSDLFPLIFSWAIYLIFISAAVELMGVSALVSVLNAIIGFIPGLIEAIIILIVGYSIAQYISQHIEKSDVQYAKIMGNILFFFIVYVAIAMALPLVGIDPTLINSILLIIIGSAGVGIAIALGLGLKDFIADMAKKYQKRIK
jgi:hypothetical protein